MRPIVSSPSYKDDPRRCQSPGSGTARAGDISSPEGRIGILGKGNASETNSEIGSIVVRGVSLIAAHDQENRGDEAVRSGPTLETLEKLEGDCVLVDCDGRYRETVAAE